MDKQFFVVTNNRDVFKCLDNNFGEPSTIKPAVTATSGSFRTGDGYTWKYMYTVDAGTNAAFYDASYLSIVANDAVIDSAIPGAIDFIAVDEFGSDYRQYHSGFIVSIANTSVLRLADDAAAANDFYADCALFIKSNPGGSQLSTITSYNGSTKIAVVSPAFDFNTTLELANVAGTVDDEYMVAQHVISTSFINKQGYFNVGDTVIQSDVGAVGTVADSNSSVIQIYSTGANAFTNVYSYYNAVNPGTQRTGTVSITNGSNVVTGTGTFFTTSGNGYANGEFIRVGDNANTQLRRVASVTNATHLLVSRPFTLTRVANVHYNVPNALSPTLTTALEANGTVVFTSLTGTVVLYDNVQSQSLQYIPGETVTEVTANGTSQDITATVDFANTTALILSNLSGTLTPEFYLAGASSGQVARISSITTFPSVTVNAVSGSFLNGKKVSFLNTNGISTGNALLISTLTFPGTVTEYSISPRVIIEGDGEGATAYSVVNTGAALINSITRVIVLDTGNGYTSANVFISGNTQHGNGAVFRALIGPGGGHGSNAASELGAVYVGITKSFEAVSIESHKIPGWGDYRTIGIIKNPLWSEAFITVGDPLRSQSTMSNANGTFQPGEIVFQTSSNVAGVVVMANTSFIELERPTGNLTANATGDSIRGLVSGATSNIRTSNLTFFVIETAGQTVEQANTGATATLDGVLSTSRIRLSSIAGKLDAGEVLFDPATNAYANVTHIAVTGDTVNATESFGMRFTQTSRVAMSTNTGPFELYEVVRQDSTNAIGIVVSTDTDYNFNIENSNGTFFVGNEVSANSTGATAIVITANSTHLGVSSSNGNWETGDRIINSVGVGADIANVYSVLILGGCRGEIEVGTDNLVGEDSGSIGRAQIANGVILPDLVRSSGEVLYIDERVPFTRSPDSREQIRLICEF